MERDRKRLDAEREELYKTIRHQQVVISWFKKKARCLGSSQRKAMIVAEEELSVSEQRQLVAVARSSYYQRGAGENEKNCLLMRRIDELYTADPTWGSRKMRDRLRLEGQAVNRKRVQRLMQIMGL